jgi:hypothetical protein
MKSKSRGKRELIHPVFLECQERCDSEYWKGVLEDLAFGKYPKQIYISNYTIQSSNRKKSFSYSFRHKPVDEILRETIDLLTLHTDLISGEEVKKKRDGNEPFKKDTWTCWKDIKKKYIKDMLLMEFCLRLKKDLSLPYKKAVDLYHKISAHVYTGQYAEIQMDNGVISCIEGLGFDEVHRTIVWETGEPKPEQVYAADDFIHHYCRRYILRCAKSNNDLLE